MGKYLKNITDFVLEQKLYIFQRKFRIDDLISYNLYTPFLINKWMKLYKFDGLAHAMFVSKEAVKTNNIVSDMRVSSKDIANKIYFNDDTKKHLGTLIEDSLLHMGDNDVYLYVFTKNSDIKHRSRQIHGFIYEFNIKKLNGLNKLDYTSKWDASGGLDKKFLEERLPKQIELFDGINYRSLITQNAANEDIISWEMIPPEFKKRLYWNIKCSKENTSIDTADFKRVLGLVIQDNELVKFNSKIENFMFVIGFHDGNGIVNEEYIILMPVAVWETYIPNLNDPEVVTNIKNMFNDLKPFKLLGERLPEKEAEWLEYVKRYSAITANTIVKFRFKRDTKGQIRIQSAININSFKNEILKNKHIRIL